MVTDVDRINGLSLLVSALVGDLVARGRLSDAEADTWEREAAAIAVGGPVVTED